MLVQMVKEKNTSWSYHDNCLKKINTPFFYGEVGVLLMLLMEGGTKCINAKYFYILISIVINVNLGIHCVNLQKLQISCNLR